MLGVVALAAALEELIRYSMERVAAHERELARYAVRRLQRVPDLLTYGPSWQDFLEGKEDRLGVFAFNLEGHAYSEVAAILAHEWGVGVRGGCFCAHQYVAQLLGISDEDAQEACERLVSGLPVDLPGMVRASLGLASSRADIDRLVEGRGDERPCCYPSGGPEVANRRSSGKRSGNVPKTRVILTKKLMFLPPLSCIIRARPLLPFPAESAIQASFRSIFS